MRPTNDHQRNQLKNSWKHLLRLAGGGCFDAFTRVKGPALAKYGSISIEELDYHVPVDVLLDAEIQAGSPVVTSLLANLQGYELVMRSQPKALKTYYLDDIRTVLNDFTRVIDELQKANADGRIDQQEKKLINVAINVAVRDLQTIQKGY